jgi:SAM-dependent methyltransferase
MLQMWLAKSIAYALQDRIHFHLIDRWNDQRLGIDATGMHTPAELSLRGENAQFAVEYFATPSWIFQRLVDSLEIDVGRFVFVDYGCGKGRVLALAAERAFLRVEGVELSEDLHRLALRNIAEARRSGALRAPVLMHHQDATEYELPKEPLVIYLFNPFGEKVITRVLDAIQATLRDTPRDAHVIYANAIHRHCFDRSPCLEEIPRSTWAKALDRLTTRWPMAIYRARTSGP